MKLLIFFIASVTSVLVTTTASPMHSSNHKTIPVSSFTEDHYNFLEDMRESKIKKINLFLASLASNQEQLESFFTVKDRNGNTILHCTSGYYYPPNNRRDTIVTHHITVSIILTYLQSPLLIQILTTTNNNNETPLDIALIKNRGQTFALLAQKACDLLDPAYLTSWLTRSFALHWAAERGNDDFTSPILAMANACDPTGGLTQELLLMPHPDTHDTPLHYAATEKHHYSICTILETAYNLGGHALIHKLFTTRNLLGKTVFDCAPRDGKIQALLVKYFKEAIKSRPLDSSPLYLELDPSSLNSKNDPCYEKPTPTPGLFNRCVGSPVISDLLNRCVGSPVNSNLLNRCVGSPSNQGSNPSSPFNPYDQ